MTRSPSNDSATTRPTAPSRGARLAWMTLIAWSMTVCASGCRTRLVVLPEDRAILFHPAGRTLQATHDYYLVPPARMQEILRALNQPLNLVTNR